MTPGIAFAADASIAPILAGGCGLRTVATYVMPGTFRSSTYSDDPVIRRGSSLRRTSAPTNRLRTIGTLLLLVASSHAGSGTDPRSRPDYRAFYSSGQTRDTCPAPRNSRTHRSDSPEPQNPV